jgi:hypothetical protein
MQLMSTSQKSTLTHNNDQFHKIVKSNWNRIQLALVISIMRVYENLGKNVVKHFVRSRSNKA